MRADRRRCGARVRELEKSPLSRSPGDAGQRSGNRDAAEGAAGSRGARGEGRAGATGSLKRAKFECGLLLEIRSRFSADWLEKYVHASTAAHVSGRHPDRAPTVASKAGGAMARNFGGKPVRTACIARETRQRILLCVRWYFCERRAILGQ